MKYILTLSILFVCLFVKAQTDYAKILIGKNEKECLEYLNSVLKQSTNKDLKVERDVSEYGQLVLKLELPMRDEEALNALSYTLMFYRFGKDVEICTTQLVFGSSKYSYGNLSNVKDTFKSVGDNEWEKPYSEIPNSFKVTAKFTKEGESYGLVYKLKELPKTAVKQ